MNQIIMLGTGNATVTQCYNTCFLLETSTTRLLVDAGGGNGVLRQGSPDKPGGLSIQLCKSEKKEFYIRYSS